MPPADLTSKEKEIVALAKESNLARYRWLDRGIAPVGYIKGMALMYERAYTGLKKGELAATAMSVAPDLKRSDDALNWYHEQFSAAGMDNGESGTGTLRHLFVLLVGLGMRESSGIYCTGRDISADNKDADTAEAGLFQTSYNAVIASPILNQLSKAICWFNGPRAGFQGGHLLQE